MKILGTYLTRVLLLIVAIQILNLSVYGRDCAEDIKNNAIGENNQIDSLGEYVAEIILDHKNAFPEDGTHNRRSNGLTHLAKHINFKMVSFRKRNPVLPSYSSSQAITIPSKEEYKNLFSQEIIPPPPKA